MQILFHLIDSLDTRTLLKGMLFKSIGLGPNFLAPMYIRVTDWILEIAKLLCGFFPHVCIAPDERFDGKPYHWQHCVSPILRKMLILKKFLNGNYLPRIHFREGVKCPPDLLN